MRTNYATKVKATTHEGGAAQAVSPLLELRRSVLTCLLFENEFYESGNTIAARITELCATVDPEQIADLAIEARLNMKLRHVPLFLLTQLSKHKGVGPLMASTLPKVINRPDELGEFVSQYWKFGVRNGQKAGKHPLSNGIKRGLAKAFTSFNAYQLAKYNGGQAEVKLRDVMFLTHPKPSELGGDYNNTSPAISKAKYKRGETTRHTGGQGEIWSKLANGELESPDTWEVALSAGSDKKETFERLMREGKLGGLATLRNLRNMIEAKVDEQVIRERLAKGCGMALPFRFVTAARYAPQLEDAIEQSMYASLEGIDKLPGRTGLLIDVSGSMNDPLSSKSETTRLDVAAGLAILAREICQEVKVATFSKEVAIVPSRRGFALRDAIHESQPHAATYLSAALDRLSAKWFAQIDRLIVITDEQSQDGVSPGFAPKNYLINVASNQHGVSYGNRFRHIDGWSEQVLAYIAAIEKEEEQGPTQ